MKKVLHMDDALVDIYGRDMPGHVEIPDHGCLLGYLSFGLIVRELFMHA